LPLSSISLYPLFLLSLVPASRPVFPSLYPFNIFTLFTPHFSLLISLAILRPCYPSFIVSCILFTSLNRFLSLTLINFSSPYPLLSAILHPSSPSSYLAYILSPLYPFHPSVCFYPISLSITHHYHPSSLQLVLYFLSCILFTSSFFSFFTFLSSLALLSFALAIPHP
jgi:hypothetical protein